jgi:hypothetical protein
MKGRIPYAIRHFFFNYFFWRIITVRFEPEFQIRKKGLARHLKSLARQLKSLAKHPKSYPELGLRANYTARGVNV